MRRVAIPTSAEWIGLSGRTGRFYPVKLAGSVVLVDSAGSVYAELFDCDSTNLVFRTLQPLSAEDLKSAFEYLVNESMDR